MQVLEEEAMQTLWQRKREDMRDPRQTVATRGPCMG